MLTRKGFQEMDEKWKILHREGHKQAVVSGTSPSALLCGSRAPGSVGFEGVTFTSRHRSSESVTRIPFGQSVRTLLGHHGNGSLRGAVRHWPRVSGALSL